MSQMVALSASFDVSYIFLFLLVKSRSMLKSKNQGYKLIHLSAWGKKKTVSKESRLYDLFRNHLLWFPDVPDSKCISVKLLSSAAWKRRTNINSCVALYSEGPKLHIFDA